MGREVLDVARALDFSAHKHRDQRRKGVAAEPYVNHVAEVARLVAEATGGTDAVAVIGALLHDTIEDTETTYAELEDLFGRDVARLVAEVTDDKSLPKAERKRLQVASAPSKSTRAKLVKLADKTSNLTSMADSPPAGWDVGRRRAYLEWAREVVAGCRGINPTLEEQFDAAYDRAMRTLEEEP